MWFFLREKIINTAFNTRGLLLVFAFEVFVDPKVIEQLIAANRLFRLEHSILSSRFRAFINWSNSHVPPPQFKENANRWREVQVPASKIYNRVWQKSAKCAYQRFFVPYLPLVLFDSAPAPKHCSPERTERVRARRKIEWKTFSLANIHQIPLRSYSHFIQSPRVGSIVQILLRSHILFSFLLSR